MGAVKRSTERIGSFPYGLGVRGKTRYEPFSIYLKFDPSKGFEKAEDPPDPDEEPLKVIFDLIVKFKKEKKIGTQSKPHCGDGERSWHKQETASKASQEGRGRIGRS